MGLLTQMSALGFGQLDFDILETLYPEDFFQPANQSQLTLSPVGDRYVYAYSSNEKNSLFVVDLETGEKKPFVGKNIREAPINFVRWKNEDQIVFQTTDGNVFFLDLKKGKRNLVYDAEKLFFSYFGVFWGNFSLPRIISLLPEDPKNILVSAYDPNGKRVVYKIPLKAGEPKEPKPFIKPTRGINSWHADLSGNVRLGLKGDENGIEFFTGLDNSKSWIPLERIFSEKSSLDLNLDRSNFLSRRDYFLGFDFDPNIIYIASNKLSDTTTLYRYNLADQLEPRKVAHDPEYDFFDLSSLSSELWVSTKRKRIIGIPYHRDKPSVYWLDEVFEGIQSKIDSHLPDSANQLTSWNEDEDRFIVAAVRSDKPTEFFLFDLDKDSVQSLGSQNETLKNKSLSKTKPIQLKGSDGITLNGYLTLADSSGDKPAPLVMLPHGGPWTRDYYGYDPVIQWLAYNGYSVMQINFRGSTGYGYEHYIASKQDFGWGIQNDINDAVDWAIEQGYASADNIAIMGFSYGGYATALALAKYPGKYKCGIAMSGIYDLVKASKNLKSQGYSGLAYSHFQEMVGREWKDKELLRSISPVHLAEQIQEPVLLVHGKLDRVASYEQSEQMHAALLESGKTSEFTTIEDEGHGYYLSKNQITAFGNAVSFLDKHLTKN